MTGHDCTGDVETCPTCGQREVNQLRFIAQHAANVMTMLDRHPSLLAHLLDTDENEGEYLRRALAAADIQPTRDVLDSMDYLDRPVVKRNEQETS